MKGYWVERSEADETHSAHEGRGAHWGWRERKEENPKYSSSCPLRLRTGCETGRCFHMTGKEVWLTFSLLLSLCQSLTHGHSGDIPKQTSYILLIVKECGEQMRAQERENCKAGIR